MFKSVFAATSLAAALVTSIGCGASADSATSDEALAQGAKSTATLTLAEARAQVDVIQAKYDADGGNELILDPSIAPAYLKDINPVFAQTAPTDKLALALYAILDVSAAIVDGGIFQLGLLDDAIPSSFADVWSFPFYWGAASSNPEFWTKLNGLIARSPVSSPSDLQLLELVTVAKPTDLFAGLQAVHWASAKKATVADAKTLPDDEDPFETLNQALFGAGDSALDSHDIDESNAFAVSVFTRSYAELRLVAPDDGENLVTLAGHLNTVLQYTGKPATSGIALAKSVLTASEVKTLTGGLNK